VKIGRLKLKTKVMKKKYYNKAIINDIHSKCILFGCRPESMGDLSELCNNYQYMQRTSFEYILYCNGSNYEFKGGNIKQYIAIMILCDAMPYRSKTESEVIYFLNLLK